MRTALFFVLACALSGCFINLNASCIDSLRNGTETDVDCGGSCVACGLNKACALNSDCASGLCSGGYCVAVGNCHDSTANGSETDIDCGGGTCSACANGKACKINSDCTSSLCAGGAYCTSFTTPSGGDTFGILAGATPVLPQDGASLFALQSGGVGSFQLAFPSDLKTQHALSGSIFVPGTIDNMPVNQIACSYCQGPLYLNAALTSSPSGTRIDFYGLTYDLGNGKTQQGFYFSTATEPVILDLYIDGDNNIANRIYYVSQTTGLNASPNHVPFQLKTH